MNGFRSIALAISLIVVISGAAWGWFTWRTVDSRQAHQWLTFANQASQHVTYEASGSTTWQGTTATFSLSQGRQGRYLMQLTDNSGQITMLGDDGHYTWHQTAAKTIRIAKTSATAEFSGARSWILGKGTVAGRRSVRLRVQSGQLRKELSIDRETGVTLAMVTLTGGREIGRMRLERIAYQPVTVPSCPQHAETEMPLVSRQQLTALLGGAQPVEPAWLPKGMTARGSFREWCDCCQQDMVVLRYSDGVRAVTLFEVLGDHQCMMSAGCHMAPEGSELISNRRVGSITVIAVGDLDNKTLTKVMQSLR